MRDYTLHSADVDDLSSWKPDDSSSWEINIQVILEGESFQFQLTSMGWLNEKLKEGNCVILGRRALMVSYSYDKLKQSVERIIEESEGASWTEFARNLNWYMQWEGEFMRG